MNHTMIEGRKNKRKQNKQKLKYKIKIYTIEIAKKGGGR